MEDLIHSDKNLENLIYQIRGKQIMLDHDLATVYGIETRILNQAVKRNIKRFPPEFMFQLTKDEFDYIKKKKEIDVQSNLISQNVTSKRGGRRKLPYVFTEQGVSMLSAVLNSDTAIKVSIRIIKAFVSMRKMLTSYSDLILEMNQMKQTLNTHDKQIETILDIISEKEIQPNQGIFFNNQVFDAYEFVTSLIKSAKKTITLIDNYIDESVLVLFSKNQNVDVSIYTKKISKQLELDLKKYNEQYRPIIIKKFTYAHDRFLIIDKEDVYHFGASLKDLGKKWFAFSKFEINTFEILKRINEDTF